MCFVSLSSHFTGRCCRSWWYRRRGSRRCIFFLSGRPNFRCLLLRFCLWLLSNFLGLLLRLGICFLVILRFLLGFGLCFLCGMLGRGWPRPRPGLHASSITGRLLRFLSRLKSITIHFSKVELMASTKQMECMPPSTAKLEHLPAHLPEHSGLGGHWKCMTSWAVARNKCQFWETEWT